MQLVIYSLTSYVCKGIYTFLKPKSYYPEKNGWLSGNLVWDVDMQLSYLGRVRTPVQNTLEHSSIGCGVQSESDGEPVGHAGKE